MKTLATNIKTVIKASSVLIIVCLLCCITVKAQTKEGNEVFTAVEKAPNYPGGIQAFYKFLAKLINYPAEARSKNIQGKVIATFIVERDGTLSNVKVLRSPDESLSKETQRVLSLSPKWDPGMQNGKVVRVQYTVPVAFTIPGKATSFNIGKTGAGTDSAKIEGMNITLSNSSGDSTITKALYLLNGKVISKEEMKKVSPESIKAINVLKGKTATDKYGDKGADGVIEITTKP
jgi:TonB family protein